MTLEKNFTEEDLELANGDFWYLDVQALNLLTMF